MSEPSTSPGLQGAGARVVSEGLGPFAQGEPPASAPSARSPLSRAWAALTEDPVLRRELIALLRSPRYAWLSSGGVVCGVLGALLLAHVDDPTLTPPELGQRLYFTFFMTSLAIFGVMAPVYSATLISGERERRTYESLLLTRLTPFRIVRGKWLASVLATLLVFAATVPAVGLAFFFGGVTGGQVLLGGLAVLLVIAVSSAMGLAISAVLPTTASAIITALLASFGAGCVGLMALSLIALGMHGFMPPPPSDALQTFVRSLGEPRGFIGFVLGPVTASALGIWLALAASVASLRPAGSDRSTPIKVWMLAMSIALAIGLALAFALAPRLSVEWVGTVVGLSMIPCALVAVDSPFRPRSMRLERRPARARLLELFGPHLVGTLRFSIVLSAWLGFAAFLAVLVGTGGRAPTGEPGAFFRLGLELAGYASVAGLVASLTAWFRARGAAASRAPAWTSLVLGALNVAVLVAAVFERRSVDSIEGLESLLMLSSFFPSFVGALVDRREVQGLALVTPAIYGSLTLVLSLWVARRVRVLARAREAEVPPARRGLM